MEKTYTEAEMAAAINFTVNETIKGVMDWLQNDLTIINTNTDKAIKNTGFKVKDEGDNTPHRYVNLRLTAANEVDTPIISKVKQKKVKPAVKV